MAKGQEEVQRIQNIPALDVNSQKYVDIMRGLALEGALTARGVPLPKGFTGTVVDGSSGPGPDRTNRGGETQGGESEGADPTDSDEEGARANRGTDGILPSTAFASGSNPSGQTGGNNRFANIPQAGGGPLPSNRIGNFGPGVQVPSAADDPDRNPFLRRTVNDPNALSVEARLPGARAQFDDLGAFSRIALHQAAQQGLVDGFNPLGLAQLRAQKGIGSRRRDPAFQAIFDNVNQMVEGKSANEIRDMATQMISGSSSGDRLDPGFSPNLPGVRTKTGDRVQPPFTPGPGINSPGTVQGDRVEPPFTPGPGIDPPVTDPPVTDPPVTDPPNGTVPYSGVNLPQLPTGGPLETPDSFFGGFNDPFVRGLGMLGADISGAGAFNFAPGQLDPARARALYNPFESDVVGAVRGDFDRLRNEAMTQVNRAATGAGAFGGSRHGILGAQALRDIGQDETTALANLRRAGYESAAGRAFNEFGLRQNLGLQGERARLGGRLAGAQMGLAQGQGLLGAGQQVRAIENQIRQEPLFRQHQSMNFLNLGMGPTPFSNTQVTQMPAGSPLGPAAAGAQIGSVAGGPGALIGGGIGLLGGLLGF